MVKLIPSAKYNDGTFDGVVLISDQVSSITGQISDLQSTVADFCKIDKSVESKVTVIPCPQLPSGRLIYSPCGNLNGDYDDSRNIYDAAVAGITRAVQAGCRRPALVLAPCATLPTPADEPWAEAPYPELVAVLGALHALYVPLETRETAPELANSVIELGVTISAELAVIAEGLEAGRKVARDIGGSDPERMAAPRIAEYLVEEFKNTTVKVEVEQTVDPKTYPLMAAVDRSASKVPRHAGKVIHLTYVGEGPTTQSLFFVGKGITYDTGGADIKAGGIMAGMHRDKCGAAAVAGLFRTLEALRPPGIKVLGSMACVRNSVGSECYVSDELITSRAGVRVRVGNTDAEGRMVMADLVCRMKELALQEPSANPTPHIFTVATLTGHVLRAYGGNYFAAMDNGLARRAATAQTLQAAGALLADPAEVSTLRKEDWAFSSGRNIYEDLIQCNNASSSATPRGHQFPACFMARAAGLNKHGLDSAKPLSYTHLDVAGSSGPYPGIPTGSPILALAARYILPKVLRK